MTSGPGSPPKAIPHRALVDELRQEEERLVKARNELTEARNKAVVARKRYAAVRDALTQILGFSPYADKGIRSLLPTNGRYRFAEMATGDAVVQVLREADRPLTLDEIVDTLSKGGIAQTARAINASLLKTSGIQQVRHQGETKYVYVAVNPEEVPLD